MVHGGLRYLQQKEFRLVYENLRERQRLLENAPFLVRPLPFLIPLFAKNGVASRALVRGYATALRIYDFTGGWRIGKRHRKTHQDRSADPRLMLPSLNTERLVAGFSTSTRAVTTRAWRSRWPEARRSTSAPTSRTTCAAVDISARRATDERRSGPLSRRTRLQSDCTVSTRHDRERDRRVGRRRLHDGRRHDVAPDHPGQGRAPERSRANGSPADVAAVLNVPGDSEASSSCPSKTRPTPSSARPTRPTTARSTSPDCTAAGRRVSAGGGERVHVVNLTSRRRHRPSGPDFARCCRTTSTARH
jgi:hypothetical protein